MGILAADQLETSRYFSSGNPLKRGSSFELSVGTIVDDTGSRSTGPFVLKPGHMVQVISREVFRLPASVTGHVTYKTALTKEGIWALTVGIVDPGWSGPVSTTLLNFSSVNKLIDRGDTFLRVTLFEHAPVDPDMLPRPISEGDYAKGVQSLAAARFPPTFLNTDEISAKAGDFVMGRIRNESLIWLGAAVAIFTIVQLVFALAPSVYETLSGTGYETTQIEHLTEQLNRLNSRLDTIERDAVGGKLP